MGVLCFIVGLGFSDKNDPVVWRNGLKDIGSGRTIVTCRERKWALLRKESDLYADSQDSPNFW